MTNRFSLGMLACALVLVGAGCGKAIAPSAASYDECVKAGGQMWGQIPNRRCQTAEGKTFAEPQVTPLDVLKRLNVEIPNLTGRNALFVPDQPADWFVIIGRTRLEHPSWVVIQKDERGKPGKIIGKKLNTDGQDDGAEAELSEATVPGEMYYATLYSENGDIRFDMKKDFPIKDEQGTAIQTTFHVYHVTSTEETATGTR